MEKGQVTQKGNIPRKIASLHILAQKYILSNYLSSAQIILSSQFITGIMLIEVYQ